MVKTSRQNLNILRMDRAFKVKQKTFRCQKLSQTWECTIKYVNANYDVERIILGDNSPVLFY